MAKDLKRRIIAEFSAQNKAKGVMAGFRRGLDSTGQAMKRMAKVGAIMTVAAAAGLAYLVKRQMNAIDATAKLSDRLGMSTEALVAMQHGANICGVETETLNKALSTLSSRLGEVDMGVGQARYSLDKLGLDYKELIGLRMDDAVGRIADQIKGLSTQAEKAAAANYLFGKSGKQLLNFFEEGSEGLKKYKTFVELVGLAYSRMDAAQVEAANDALTNVRAAMAGIYTQITIQLAPYLEILANKFVDVATAGEGMGANVTKAFEYMTLAIVRAAGEVEKLGVALYRLTSPVEAAKKNIEAIRIATKRYREITGEKRRLRPGKPKLFEQLVKEEREKAGLTVMDRESEIIKWFENLRKKAQPDFMTTFPEVIKFEREPFSWEKVPQIITEEQKELREAMLEHRKKMVAEGGALWEMEANNARVTYETELAVVTQTMEAEEAIRKEKLQRMEGRITEFSMTFRDVMASGLEASMRDFDNWGDHIKSLLEELYWAAIRMAFLEPVAGALARGLTGAMGAILGPGIFATPAPTTPTVFTSPHGGSAIGSAQHGGEVLRTGLAVIHKGETYSGVQGSGGKGGITIIVNNVPETYEISEAEEYMLGDDRIINLFMQKLQTDGPLRRSIKQLRR